MNVSALASLAILRCSNCNQTTVGIANTQPITNLLAATNALSSAEVDAILIALDGNGLWAGTVDLSGQTPPAYPGATGLAAITSLRVKTWTVTVDQPAWAPATEQVTWIDTNGTFTNDLATFQATADYATVTSMVFGGTGLLTSLTGLSGLPTLATLDCNTNALTTLDLTGCGALTSLYCYSCGITGTLDVSPCTALTILDCNTNPNLTGLTLTGLIALGSLSCYSCDITGTLDVSPCTALTYLDCNTNPNLTGLTLTGLTALATLSCYSCGITGTLDVSPCIAMVFLICNDNGMLTAGVDGTLAALVTAHLAGAGIADLSGTNQSPTLGVNNVDKLLLELPANGWTVTVTP